MCLAGGAPKQTAAPIAAPGSDVIRRQGEVEQRLRRARLGAAADVLTSPTGAAGAKTTFGGV